MIFPLRIWHLIVLVGTNYYLHKNNGLKRLKITNMEFKILHIDYIGSLKNRKTFDNLSKDCGLEITVTNLVIKKAVFKKYLDKFPLDTSLILNDSEDIANYFTENANKFDYVSFSMKLLSGDRTYYNKLELKYNEYLRKFMLDFAFVNK